MPGIETKPENSRKAMFYTSLTGFEFKKKVNMIRICLYLQNVLFKCITSQMLLLVTSS